MAKNTAKKSSTKQTKVAKKKSATPNVHWQAEGYQSINIFLTVSDPAKALKFYQTAFGFKKKQAMTAADGSIMHAELTHEGSTIMMGKESREQQMFVPNHYKGTSITIYVYTPNVDAVCKKAVKAGAVCLQKPQDMYWGDRICMLTDPDGYLWMFATHIKEVDLTNTHP